MTVFIIIVAALTGYVIGWSIERRRTNKRIHAMCNLPKESESVDDLEETVSLLQRFIDSHLYVKDNWGHYHYNHELDKQLSHDENVLTYPEPSHYTIALVGLCHKLGLEVVIREKKDGGEERIF